METGFIVFWLFNIFLIAFILKKFIEQRMAKERICPSCSKPRLVWPDCYTCVNPDCERFVDGLTDPE